jgi:hypothetical protein
MRSMEVIGRLSRAVLVLAFGTSVAGLIATVALAVIGQCADPSVNRVSLGGGSFLSIDRHYGGIGSIVVFNDYGPGGGPYRGSIVELVQPGKPPTASSTYRLWPRAGIFYHVIAFNGVARFWVFAVDLLYPLAGATLVLVTSTLCILWRVRRRKRWAVPLEKSIRAGEAPD